MSQKHYSTRINSDYHSKFVELQVIETVLIDIIRKTKSTRSYSVLLFFEATSRYSLVSIEFNQRVFVFSVSIHSDQSRYQHCQLYE